MMATSRDFVYDEQGEMLPSDSAAAAARRKELDDDARTVSDAKDAAKAPAKAPVAAKAKSKIVTKEELAKSGLSLRDYMNKQRGLTRRDGKAPERKTAPSAKGSTIQSMDTDVMRTASRTAAKEAGEKRKASPPGKASTTAKKPEPYNPPAAKFFKSLRARGEKDLAERGMAKGGSINGIAKRGLTKCKTV
jgi:hypothetical protein